MEYTVQSLARLAGISPRTLRYYDQIGLLRPVRESNNYRIYGQRQVDILQQILFYRELGVPLEEIGAILEKPEFDRLDALREHRRQLLERRERLDLLLENVQRSIAAGERGITMQDNEKFMGFKRQMVEKNEAEYGSEIREKYGDDTVDASNAKLMGLTQEEYQRMEELSAKMLELLDAAYATGDPSGPVAKELAETHKEWLGYSWSTYSPEAHRGLVDMYVADDRFKAYYDRGEAGKAEFLRDAVCSWLG